ncbi:uncharacterized protein LOC113040287 [Xyrichtys novacula]|uniref:Uncharacterized protein LOC113040287 n=1 Tax=Xyrichtys novacula TaxID=13765 RepID=A0AAV1EZK9_XYRNO|nr:uncharacterized protein LOC113040287 [Xyrichtys novacula]
MTPSSPPVGYSRLSQPQTPVELREDDFQAVDLVVFSVGVGVSLPLGSDEIKNLTVSTGDTVTLPAGSAELQGDYSVLWSLKNGNEEVKLVTCDAGEPPKYFKENLDLDTTYGSLTFGPLRVEDSGVCEGEITDGDSNVHRYKYKITVSVRVSPPVGGTEIKTLPAIAGEDLTFLTGSTKLSGDFSVMWWLLNNSSEKETLITCYGGKTQKYSHKNLSLDQTTGALTIKSVGIQDQGVYGAHIINGDNTGEDYTYNVTVTERRPIAGPSPKPPQMQRSHLGAIIPSIGFVVVISVLVFRACCHQKCQKSVVTLGTNWRKRIWMTVRKAGVMPGPGGQSAQVSP